MHIQDETSPLEIVIVGVAQDPGPISPINATQAAHLKKGSYPTEESKIRQVDGFAARLEACGVTVWRPENIPGTGQLFPRDIGITIGSKFLWANPKHERRHRERTGIEPLLPGTPDQSFLQASDEIRFEGGDIVLLKNTILVGVGEDSETARTNMATVEYLEQNFPDWNVAAVRLNASDFPDANPKEKVLHLDCAFQPVGHDKALIYLDGFWGRPEILYDLLGEKNLIEITADEMFHLGANIFSISPTKIISGTQSQRINTILRDIGIEVIEVDYGEVSKLGGSFRCSTLPVKRRS